MLARYPLSSAKSERHGLLQSFDAFDLNMTWI